jgi:predicted dehydrogenase
VSMRQARLGVVGLGAAGSRHARTVASDAVNAELAAVVDPRDDVAEDFARRLGAPRATYAELLADPSVDGVVLATPTPMHPAMIEQAAEAGKHVFCEKPLSLDMASSARAVEAAERHGISLQVGFVRRFDPDWRDARERICSGQLGEVYFFRAGQRERIDYSDLSYIEQVGNFFHDVMVHEFDVARWMVGEVVEVNAWGANPTNPKLGDVGDAQVTCVQLRFANGALGTIDGTMLSRHGYDCYTEVLGHEGAIRIGYGSRTTDVVAIAAGQAQVGYPTDFRERFRTAFIGEIEHFADAILEQRAPAVGGLDALAATAIAEAATESLLSGRTAAVRAAPHAALPGAGA